MILNAVALWLIVAAACAMLTHRLTRNAAYMVLAGSVMALFLHYGLAEIAEVRQTAILLWTAAAVLLLSNLRAEHRRRRSA